MRPERLQVSDPTGDTRTTATPTLTLRRPVHPEQSGPDSPQHGPASTEPPQPGPAKPEPSKGPAPVRFLQGLLNSVDCSAPPAAVRPVVSGTRTRKFTVADTNLLVSFGLVQFPCSWTQRK